LSGPVFSRAVQMVAGTDLVGSAEPGGELLVQLAQVIGAEVMDVPALVIGGRPSAWTQLRQSLNLTDSGDSTLPDGR
jgi:hypothetical protein